MKTLDMQHLTIEFDLPTDQPIPEAVRQDVRNAGVIYLYKKGILSMTQAANVMGCHRRDFEEMLPEYGYTMMDEQDFGLEREYINQHA